MATGKRLADVPNCPYSTLSELVAAHRSGQIFLSVDQSFAYRWPGLAAAKSSVPTLLFHYLMMWSTVWVGVVMASYARPSLGFLRSGLLVLTSLIASVFSRPWRGQRLGLAAFGALGYAWISMNALLAWIAGTWCLTYVVLYVWIKWCAAQFTRALLSDEALLVTALENRTARILPGRSTPRRGDPAS